MKVWGRAGMELKTTGSAIRLTTDHAMGPRALDKPVYRVKYENIWKDTHLFKFLCVSCTKIKIRITQLMFFRAECLKCYISFLVWEKVEEI